MVTKSTQNSKETTKAKRLEEFIPLKTWDLNSDTKFVQFLNVPYIEKLYQRVNLINLNKIEEKDYFYVRGCLDTLYALIGVDTPLRKIIDKDLADFADDRLLTYINAVTSHLEVHRRTRKATLKEKKRIDKEDEQSSSATQLLQHILNEASADDDDDNDETDR